MTWTIGIDCFLPLMMEYEIADIMFLVKCLKSSSDHFNIYDFVEFCIHPGCKRDSHFIRVIFTPKRGSWQVCCGVGVVVGGDARGPPSEAEMYGCKIHRGSHKCPL